MIISHLKNCFLSVAKQNVFSYSFKNSVSIKHFSNTTIRFVEAPKNAESSSQKSETKKILENPLESSVVESDQQNTHQQISTEVKFTQKGVLVFLSLLFKKL